MGAGVSKTFTVTNNGSNESGMLDTTVAGPDQDDFDLPATAGPDNECQDATLGVGDTCDMKVTFDPGMGTSQTRLADLIVDSTNPGTDGQPVANLTGNAA